MNERLRAFLVVIIAVVVGYLAGTSSLAKLSAVEAFVTAEALMNVTSIVYSLSRRPRWGGPIGALLNVLGGLKLIRLLLNDFILFIFVCIWTVKVCQMM